MASVTSVTKKMIETLRRPHLSSAKLIFLTRDPDPYTITKEKSCEDTLHLLRDNKSLWKIEDDWSDEAVSLREMLATGQPFSEELFYSFIKSLRLVNKEIVTVDNSLKKFYNLEDLIISGNYLLDCNPAFLPDTLSLLELNSNTITFRDNNGQILSKGIPHLKHLGLGRNVITSSDWFKPSLWPSLVSLDLSDNNLVDLPGLLDKVASLPALKALVLMGNPLGLVCNYRTVIVNRLDRLTSLDDVPIAADETLNAPPIATAIAASKLESYASQALFFMRIGSVITGLPQPPVNEVTLLPADWFFRVELIIPTELFNNNQFPTTIFNQPIGDVVVDAAVNPKAAKQAASEKLNPCVERDVANSTVKICSHGLKYHPALQVANLFQPIVVTNHLGGLRDILRSSSIRVAIVLLIRSIITPEDSRPPSGKDKKDKLSKEEKQAKDNKDAAKNRRATQAAVEGTVTTYERIVLAESGVSTGSFIMGSNSSSSVKLNTPSSHIMSIVDQIEKSRPPSVTPKKNKRAEVKSPKGERAKSPHAGDRKSPHGDKKSPREKTPPAKERGAKGAPIVQLTQGAAGEAAAPPPPDMQASFSFDLFRVKAPTDVQKWSTIVGNSTSIMAVSQ